MPDIQYVPDFFSKVLLAESHMGTAEALRVVIPSVVRPNKPFTLSVTAVDTNGLVSTTFNGNIEVCLSEQENLTFEIPFRENQPAAAKINGLTLDKEGFYRFKATLCDKVFYSNPTLCSCDETPIYWGDPHIHSVLSNCHADLCRPLFFAYIHGRYVSLLDWLAVADHVSNGRCSDGAWNEQVAQGQLFNDPPEFVTLPAYEASLKGGCGGDVNVYLKDYPQQYIDDYDAGNMQTLADKLDALVGEGNYLLVPHHTTRSNKHGEISDDIYPGREKLPCIEIHSKWGTSEYRGNTEPLLDVNEGPSFVHDFLQRGFKVGFIGGTDTHSSMTFGAHAMEAPQLYAQPGLTAVRCDALLRENVWKAINTRRCYATSGERIYLAIQINDIEMGQSSSLQNAKTVQNLYIRTAAESDIVSIEIIRNGSVIHHIEPDHWFHEDTWNDNDDLTAVCIDSKYLGKFVYYHARVTTASGAKAWSSPIWFIK